MPHARQRFTIRVGAAAACLLALSAGCSSANGKNDPAPSVPSSSAPSSPPASDVASSSPSVASGLDPLTGLAPSTPAAATRPALGVKVDNVKGAWPQAGLNQADIVFVIPVEGGLSRLLAVYHSTDVPLVGPVRSARPVDSDIMDLFGHSYFAFSGGSKTDLAPITGNPNITAMWWDVTPSLFTTRTDHAVPHQVFASSQTLYAGGQARKPVKTPPPAVFSYSASAPAGAQKATSITASYNAATSGWTWDGKQYLRTQDGNPDKLMDGSQVSAANVVVLSVSVHNTAAVDAHGSPVPVPVMTGTGTAWVFRDGVMEKGVWNRPKASAPMKLVTSSGAVMALAPGRAWIEILPDSHTPQIR